MKRSLLLFALAAGGVPAEELRVSGSDLLGPELAAAIGAYAGQNELTLSRSFVGSRAAMEDLQAGRADVGLIVLRPDEPLPVAPFLAVPLAYRVVVVAVPDASPLTQVTLPQLAGIYGAATAQSLTRWGELGLGGVWISRTISPQAMAAGRGLDGEYFRARVLKGGEFRAVVKRHEAWETAWRALTADEGAIALLPELPASRSGVKAVAVAPEGAEVGVTATPDNVHAGGYPLRLPVWLVVRRVWGRERLDVLRFLLGDDVAAALQRAQWMPVPQTARQQFVFDLEAR